MAQSEVLNTHQFSRTSASGDLSNTYEAKFKGNKNAGSKTMRNSGGKLPPKPTIHLHHRRAGKRTMRAH